jgi:hypothetical protein
MSSLEIKGGILEIIANIDDVESLEELKKLVTEFVSNRIKSDTDFWDELSEMEQAELEQAIAEGEDSSNHVTHDVVIQKYKQWLGK